MTLWVGNKGGTKKDAEWLGKKGFPRYIKKKKIQESLGFGDKLELEF